MYGPPPSFLCRVPELPDFSTSLRRGPVSFSRRGEPEPLFIENSPLKCYDDVIFFWVTKSFFSSVSFLLFHWFFIFFNSRIEGVFFRGPTVFLFSVGLPIWIAAFFFHSLFSRGIFFFLLLREVWWDVHEHSRALRPLLPSHLCFFFSYQDFIYICVNPRFFCWLSLLFLSSFFLFNPSFFGYGEFPTRDVSSDPLLFQTPSYQAIRSRPYSSPLVLGPSHPLRPLPKPTVLLLRNAPTQRSANPMSVVSSPLRIFFLRFLIGIRHCPVSLSSVSTRSWVPVALLPHVPFGPTGSFRSAVRSFPVLRPTSQP